MYDLWKNLNRRTEESLVLSLAGRADERDIKVENSLQNNVYSLKEKFGVKEK